MASKSIKTLGKFIPKDIFDTGTGALLPKAYKKFYKEWKLTEPTAVHYIPEEGKWKRNELTGEVKPVQNIPIPLLNSKESDQQIWGGESVVQGFTCKPLHRRVPHFWFPVLKRSIVYSEILNKHITVVVTDRTINLINSNYGFDHYLLKTPACDLKSLLALSLKRKILHELQDGCPAYKDTPEKQKTIHDRYKNYLAAYTPEEIEWYGYSFLQACKKMESIIEEREKPVPLKTIYRSRLIEQLKEAKIKEASETEETIEISSKSTSWLHKINPFGSKKET